jgi:tRNA (guanine-N7-)-methyltransferase
MSKLLNPDDFVIVRRRKRYRFAKFANAENCFELEQWTKKAIDIVELGAGTAFFLVELARRYPEKTFAAVDVKADRLQRGAYEALEQNIKNIVFIRARADQLEELFETQSIESLWLTFADPFPRDRSARRRMTHPIYLERYVKLLKKSGNFYMKHDNPDFFIWSLEELVKAGWYVNKLSFDLHASEIFEDAKIMTSYEQKWLIEGRTVHFMGVMPPQLRDET